MADRGSAKRRTGWLGRLLKSVRSRLSGEARGASALPDSLREAVKALDRWLDEQEIGHAVVGGLALAAHGVVRATRDLDLLVEASGADALHAHLTALGFETISRGEDVATYLLGRLRIDVLLARRAHTRAMLNRAGVLVLDGVEVHTVAVEDLIGLKLQALRNDPSRSQDRADIAALLTRHGRTLDLERVREYAQVLGQEALLDELSQRS